MVSEQNRKSHKEFSIIYSVVPVVAVVPVVPCQMLKGRLLIKEICFILEI
jgi:hypothetical protein